MRKATPKKFDFLDTIIVRHTGAPFVTDLDSPTFFDDLLKNKRYLESVLIASSSVYDLLLEWVSGNLKDEKKIAKLKNTLLSYFIRQCGNPTPFGYFGGVGTIKWQDESENKAVIKKLLPNAKLDNDLLHRLVNYFNSVPQIRADLLYKPNNTIYQKVNQIRYIEEFFENDEIKYKISGVEQMDIISDIIEASRDGIRIVELVSLLLNEKKYEYEETVLAGFIEQLIDEKLLVSTLQVNSTGVEPFKGILRELRNRSETINQYDAVLLSQLELIEEKLMEINNVSLGIEEGFDALCRILDKIGVEYDRKKVLQVDMYSELKGDLSSTLQQDLEDAINLMSLMPQNERKPRLDEFKKKFLEKYENATVPLMEALDPEAGISFGEFKYENENVFLDEAYFSSTNKAKLVEINQQEGFKKKIYKKYVEAYIANEYTVFLDELDTQGLSPCLGKLAPTIQVLFTVCNAGNEPRIMLVTSGNSSAGKLIARFADYSEDIYKSLKEITEFEQGFYTDAIVAEIVHIPEHRMGNITFRPHIRNFELPILTQSLLDDEFQIDLRDLYLTVKNDVIIVFSKKHQLRIIPKLTNAHNYNKKTNPIYQFLAELEYQEILPSLAFDISDFNLLSPFVPRIQFKNVIIRPASWSFRASDFKESFGKAENVTKQNISKFLAKWKLPNVVEYYFHGITTIINWQSVSSVKLFLKYILNGSINSISLTELFDEASNSFVVDGKNRPYFSQCLALVKNKYAEHQPLKRSFFLEDQLQVQRKFVPGHHWIYYKLYGGINTSEKFLKNKLPGLLEQLKEKSLLKKFFFIRYSDPDYHLRCRFLAEQGKVNEMMMFLNDHFKSLHEDQCFWKIQLDTYNRELERYGDKTIEMAESIFNADSLFWIGLKELGIENMDYVLPIFFVRSVNSLLGGIGLDEQEKYLVFETLRNSYEKEFNVKQQENLRNLINKKEKELRFEVEKVMKNNFSAYARYVDPTSLMNLLEVFQNNVSLACKEYAEKVSKSEMLQIVPSLIHMHAIRCFITKPRENELFVYNVLWTYFKKVIKKAN